MITKTEIAQLAERQPSEESPVLSVYLDTDQNQEANIKRGYLIALKNMLRDTEEGLTAEQSKEFLRDAKGVVDFLEDYREPQRGLVILSDASDDFFWVGELRIPVPNGVWWNDTPYLRPLLELMDEHERYSVVLTDRQHSRLFTVFLGEIEENHEAFASLDVKRIESPGQENAWAQLKIQHKADQHAHLHLKQVAEMLSRLAQKHEFDRLIFAGTAEATAELRLLLPKPLRSRVVRTIHLSLEAKEDEVLQETMKIETEVEREREKELVESLITAASKRQRAVLGVDGILEALQERRIWQLFYSEGFTSTGKQCTNCGALLPKTAERCSYCGGTLREINDLVAFANERVLDMQGKVEQVRAMAAERLQQAGSIGALLRF